MTIRRRVPRAVPLAAGLLALGGLLLPARSADAQRHTDSIRLNQIGFYPGAPKVAAVVAASGGSFQVVTPDLTDTVFVGTLREPRTSVHWPDTVWTADFSAVSRPGTYRIAVPGLGHSYAFEVRPRVHEEVARAALKAFYMHRVSVPIPAEYAGDWARAAGHPDDRVVVHPSAADARRPAGTVISSPGGWYDAGDYNKYVVNSGITTATLLALYEDFPAYFGAQQTGIPESGNAVPDLLDEALYNVRWMLTMQDPNDGGVYHKLTEARFSGMVMPSELGEVTRYVVQKSTPAALNFAAVMAQASRVLRGFEHAVPGLADTTLAAAQRAWQWARQHPDSLYDQNALNQRHDPDVVTGAYGDRDARDEFAWAAAELYITTRSDSFFTAVPILGDSIADVPTWNRVRTLGYQSLLRHRDRLTPRAQPRLRSVERLLLARADTLVRDAGVHPWRTPMGRDRDFVWGSNAVAANQGILLVQAYRATGDRRYLRAALDNLDYLLGRNATGYSFVTGYGDRPTQHPHQRLSEADGVLAPLPGWLAGGPNPAAPRQDRCPGYPTGPNGSYAPDRTYLDHACSYAANEIAINWQAPLVYLASALEALQYQVTQ